jgi:hypothetical protein
LPLPLFLISPNLAALHVEAHALEQFGFPVVSRYLRHQQRWQSGYFAESIHKRLAFHKMLGLNTDGSRYAPTAPLPPAHSGSPDRVAAPRPGDLLNAIEKLWRRFSTSVELYP